MSLAYGEDVYAEGLDGLAEDDLLAAAGNVTRGVPIATPVFDGAKEADVNDALVRAGFSSSGQSVLFDGRTGEQFARPVTVGVKYLLKLHHLVDDKIHARSTGPCRTKVYESIVKGEDNFEAGIPESFNVLVKEVRGLGLNMELLDAEEDE